MSILHILIIGALGVFIVVQSIGFVKDIKKRKANKKKTNSENEVDTNNEN